MGEFLGAAAGEIASKVDGLIDSTLDTATSAAETVSDLAHGDTGRAADDAASTLEHGESAMSLGMSDKIEKHVDQYLEHEGAGVTTHQLDARNMQALGEGLSDLGSGLLDTASNAWNSLTSGNGAEVGMQDLGTDGGTMHVSEHGAEETPTLPDQDSIDQGDPYGPIE